MVSLLVRLLSFTLYFLSFKCWSFLTFVTGENNIFVFLFLSEYQYEMGPGQKYCFLL